MCFQQYLDVQAVMCVSSMLYLHHFSQTEPAQRVNCMALPQKWGNFFKFFSQRHQQVDAPDCSPHYPFNAERQAGKLSYHLLSY